MELKQVKLADVADLTAGFAFKSKEFIQSEIKAIKIGDIVPEIRSCSLPGVDISAYSPGRLEKYLCKPNDYLVAMTGNTIGKIGRIVEGTAYANQRVLKISAKLNQIDSGFLWAVISSRVFNQYIMSHIDSHSAQPNISAGTIGNYSFLLPTAETQNRISNVLMSLERKIEINNQLNDYLAA